MSVLCAKSRVAPSVLISKSAKRISLFIGVVVDDAARPLTDVIESGQQKKRGP